MKLATIMTYLTAPWRGLILLAVMPYAIYVLFIKGDSE